jgi:hypothetical protein
MQQTREEGTERRRIEQLFDAVDKECAFVRHSRERARRVCRGPDLENGENDDENTNRST